MRFCWGDERCVPPDRHSRNGWLIGPFVTAHLRVYRDPAAVRAFLAPFAHHLADHGLGSVSEIFDGDPPLTRRGCIAQAWSVAEVLRAWHAADEVKMFLAGPSAHSGRRRAG